MTAGFRSTEFWAATAVKAVGVALCGVGVVRQDDLLACAGAGLLAVASAAYSHSRGKAKAPRPYLPPQGKL